MKPVLGNPDDACNLETPSDDLTPESEELKELGVCPEVPPLNLDLCVSVELRVREVRVPLLGESCAPVVRAKVEAGVKDDPRLDPVDLNLVPVDCSSPK